jgi:hypothetical protein
VFYRKAGISEIYTQENVGYTGSGMVAETHTPPTPPTSQYHNIGQLEWYNGTESQLQIYPLLNQKKMFVKNKFNGLSFDFFEDGQGDRYLTAKEGETYQSLTDFADMLHNDDIGIMGYEVEKFGDVPTTPTFATRQNGVYLNPVYPFIIALSQIPLIEIYATSSSHSFATFNFPISITNSAFSALAKIVLDIVQEDDYTMLGSVKATLNAMVNGNIFFVSEMTWNNSIIVRYDDRFEDTNITARTLGGEQIYNVTFNGDTEAGMSPDHVIERHPVGFTSENMASNAAQKIYDTFFDATYMHNMSFWDGYGWIVAPIGFNEVTL